MRAAVDAQDWPALDRWAAWLDEHDTATAARRQAVSLGGCALWYAHLGLRVFPLQPHAKVPRPGSHGCKDATTDIEQIQAWWQAEPDANIGIATGYVVDVIDIDGPAGVASWAHLEGLPPLLGQVSTPRAGGVHLYVPATNGKRGNAARIADGIDYRGRGGYVVAPPSVNGNGKRYRWLRPLEVCA